MADARTGMQGRPVETFLPATFLERGASVPFTAHSLAGTRVRRSRDGKLESVLPSPVGRGVYVMPWSGVGSLCRPTAHDMRLIEGIATLRVVTPRTVRALSRGVAAEGFAGRPAMNAARAAIETAAKVRRQTHHWLLLRLIEDCEPGGQVPHAQDISAAVQARALQVMVQLADRVGCNAHMIADALEELADRLAPLGVSPDIADACLPRMCAGLSAMRDGLRAAAAEIDTSQVDVMLIADIIDLLLTRVATAIGDALTLTGRMGHLLQHWLADPAAMDGVISQPEWLLDGWDRIHSLWRLREADRRRALPIRDVVALLPLAPRAEPLAAGMYRALQNLMHDRQKSKRLAGDWESLSGMLEHIARNEAVLAYAA
jgi:hypothetical protein